MCLILLQIFLFSLFSFLRWKLKKGAGSVKSVFSVSAIQKNCLLASSSDNKTGVSLRKNSQDKKRKVFTVQDDDSDNSEGESQDNSKKARPLSWGVDDDEEDNKHNPATVIWKPRSFGDGTNKDNH